MRRLATIQQIINLEPIEGADSIVKATVLGWHVVVKKGEFNIGDKCVYIEIDSIVPSNNPVFAFLEPRKYRVKTIKLRGQISQGLCLSVESFQGLSDYPVDTDVTEILQIKKHDPQAALERAIVSNKKSNWLDKTLMRFSIYRKLKAKLADNTKGFPAEIVSKTDEERVQNLTALIKKYKGDRASITEKLDGQSYTAVLRKKRFHLPFFSKYEFIICSRNLKVSLSDNSSYADVTKKYGIKKILQNNIGKYSAITIQGEICGPGIQKNKYQFGENKLFLFNVHFGSKNQQDHINLSQKNVEEFAKANNLLSVPYLGEIELTDSVDELVKLSSSARSVENPKAAREGIVVRQAKDNGEYSFKVINPEFLLKNDE